MPETLKHKAERMSELRNQEEGGCGTWRGLECNIKGSGSGAKRPDF